MLKVGNESNAASSGDVVPFFERSLAELSRDLVEVVAMEHRALREGFWNRFHMTAVDAACLRVEAALEREALDV